MNIACDLTALNPEERARHRELLDKLRAATTRRSETEEGVELHFDRTRLRPSELEEWIALESRCCPFLQFDVALRLGGGGEGVKAFLRAWAG